MPFTPYQPNQNSSPTPGFKPYNPNVSQSLTGIPTSEPPSVKQGFLSKLGSFTGKAALGLGNALTQSEQTLGKGLSTVGSAIPNQVSDINAQDLQGQSKLIQAIHAQTDPAKKAHLVQAMKNIYGSTQGLTQEDLNPAFGLSNKQVIGAAAGTALDVASMGSYGNAAKGAQTGQLLSKSAEVAKGAEAVGTTAKVLTSGEKALNLAKTVGKGAALGYGYDVAGNLQANKDNILKPGLGTVVGGAIPLITTIGSEIAKSVTGVTTGAGKDVIQRAVNNPDEVNAAINKYAKTPEAKQSLVDSAKDAIQSFLQDRNKQYSESLSGLQATEPISKQTVIDSFDKAIGKFGGRVEDGALVIGDTALSTSEQKGIQDVYDIIKGWKNVTPQGLDTLRQRITNEMGTFKLANNGRDNVVLGAVKNALTDEMKSKISGYGDMLSSYGSRTQAAKELAAELSLKSGNAKPTTQLNQIMRLFKKDPTVLENLDTVMGKKEANQFMNEISGAILSSWMPSGGKMANTEKAVVEGGAALAAGLLHASPVGLGIAAGGVATASPRIVGKGAVIAGKLAQKGIGKAAARTATVLAGKIKK